MPQEQMRPTARAPPQDCKQQTHACQTLHARIMSMLGPTHRHNALKEMHPGLLQPLPCTAGTSGLLACHRGPCCCIQPHTAKPPHRDVKLTRCQATPCARRGSRPVARPPLPCWPAIGCCALPSSIAPTGENDVLLHPLHTHQQQGLAVQGFLTHSGRQAWCPQVPQGCRPRTGLGSGPDPRHPQQERRRPLGLCPR